MLHVCLALLIPLAWFDEKENLTGLFGAPEKAFVGPATRYVRGVSAMVLLVF